jgi:hypothetical protein
MSGFDGTVSNATADQLARTGSEHPFTGPEPVCSISIEFAKKALRDWTNRNNEKKKNTGNPQLDSNRQRDFYTSVLCQKNEGSVKIKQRPTKMGGRTIYRTPFQIGIDR